MSGIAIRVATAAPPRKVISSRCFMTAPNPRISASYPVTQGRRKGLEAAISTSAMRAACLLTVTGIVKADVRDRRQRAKTRLPPSFSESQQLKHRLFKVPFRDREIGGMRQASVYSWRNSLWRAIQRKTVALPGIPASLQMARRLLPSASRAQIDMAT
jgi:hypothetical protein